MRICKGDESLRCFETAGELAEQLRGTATSDIKESSGSLDDSRTMSGGDWDGAILGSSPSRSGMMFAGRVDRLMSLATRSR